MKHFDKYQLVRILTKNKEEIIWRAQLEEDSLQNASPKKFLIKTIKPEALSASKIKQIHHEYKLFNALKSIDAIARTVQFICDRTKEQVGIVFADHGKKILSSYLIQGQKLELLPFLRVSIALAKMLGHLHEQGLIHQNINPASMLIDIQAGELEIIDLSLASEMAQESSAFALESPFKGNLAYISPEQTGRLNRPLDYRTDFYSLGVTFYQMLSGTLPFQAQDDIGLIHAHITQIPSSPHAIDPKIPSVLSAIIMKLMEKNAESRYQSATTLLSDLKRCVYALEKHKHDIPSFAIAQQDVSAKFAVSKQLYGREQEIQKALAAFDEAATSKNILFLIDGEAGIGKTALVNELQSVLVQKGALFIQGKCDQFKRDVTFQSISEALNDLADQLAALSEAEYRQWQEQITSAVATNGRIITELSEGMGNILGEQPEVPLTHTAAEAENRFYYTLLQLLHVICKRHPLVIFIDDLQWADYSSLQLIKNWILSKQSKLLIIASYRSNEIDATHILSQSLEWITEKQANIVSVSLGPLTSENISHLLSDTFCFKQQDNEFSRIILEKTGGNPFHTHLFLKSLYQDKLIHFNSEDGSWDFNVESIKALQVSTNIVDFLIPQLRSLPQLLQTTLQHASAIGNHFDINLLSQIVKLPLEKTCQILGEALKSGLLMQLNGKLKPSSQANIKSITYRFAHDRIQQACYKLIPQEELGLIHLKIGRILSAVNTQQQQDRLIDTVRHYNLGIHLLEDKEERLLLCQLNSQAALKAMNNLSYDYAFTLATQARSLLENDCWETQYDLAFQIFFILAKNAYISNHQEKAEQICALMLEHAQTKLHKAEIFNMRATHYCSKGQTDNSINACVQGFHFLGIKFKGNPTLLEALFTFIRAYRIAKKFNIDTASIPTDSTNQRKLHCFEGLLTAIAITASFAEKKNLQLYLSSKIVTLSSQYKFASYDWSNFAVITAILLRNPVIVRHQFDLVEQLIQKFYYPTNIPHLYFMRSCFDWWKDQHQQQIAQKLKTALEHAAQAGDKLVSSHILPFYGRMRQISILKKCKFYEKILPTIIEQGVISASCFTVFTAGYYLSLCGKTTSSTSISYENYSEEYYLNAATNSHLMLPLFEYHTTKMNLAFMYNHYELALNHLKQALRYKLVASAGFPIRDYVFFSFMTDALGLTEYKLTLRQRYQARRRMHKAYKQMHAWSKYCPMNFEHFLFLMQAEQYRLKKNSGKAQVFFEKAIEAAEKNNYLEWIPLIYERSAKCAQTFGLKRIALHNLQLALHHYQAQGMSRKLSLLQKECAALLEEVMQPINLTLEAEEQEIATPALSSWTKNTLDFNSFLKISAVLTGEIKLERLIENILKLILENAGADSGALLLKTTAGWVVQADGSSNNIRVLLNIPLDDIERNGLSICKRIVEYTIRQVKILVVGDVQEDKRFKNDPYIQQHKPHAILCLPLENQGVLRGIIYLENKHSKEAFNIQQQTILSTLSSQLAVAIENTSLYKDIFTLNQAYEKFIPKQFLNILKKPDITQIALGNQVRKNMVVLFLDIRNFTAFSEKMDVQETFNFINDFLGVMEPVIHYHHGFIDKYIGDSIMALFYDIDEALFCAKELFNQLNTFNQKRPGYTIRMGIGIHYGLLTLGVVGGKERLEITVIATAVNMASRIEGLNKKFNTDCLISEEAFQQLTHGTLFKLRKLAKVQVKGIKNKITVYEMCVQALLAGQIFQDDYIEQFNLAMEYLSVDNIKAAYPLLRMLAERCPLDQVCLYYLKNIKAIIKTLPNANYSELH